MSLALFLVKTEIVINASQETIWQILTRFEDFPQWNPFVTSVIGHLAVGEILTISIDIPNQGKMNFKPKVCEVSVNKGFTWQGKLLIPGIFDGRHSFQFVPLAKNQCRFIHHEVFSGFLAAMMWKKLSVNVTEGFIKMNQALKKQCEHD